MGACIALVHSYVCVCVCVWVDGWGLFKCMYSSCTELSVFRVCVCVLGNGGGMSGGDLRPPSPVICKSHEL